MEKSHEEHLESPNTGITDQLKTRRANSGMPHYHRPAPAKTPATAKTTIYFHPVLEGEDPARGTQTPSPKRYIPIPETSKRGPVSAPRERPPLKPAADATVRVSHHSAPGCVHDQCTRRLSYFKRATWGQRMQIRTSDDPGLSDSSESTLWEHDFTKVVAPGHLSSHHLEGGRGEGERRRRVLGKDLFPTTGGWLN